MRDITKFYFSDNYLNLADIMSLHQKLNSQAERAILSIEEIIGLSWGIGMIDNQGPVFSINCGAGLQLEKDKQLLYVCKDINKPSDINDLYKIVTHDDKNSVCGVKPDEQSPICGSFYLYRQFTLNYKEVYDNVVELIKFIKKDLPVYDLSCHISSIKRKVLILTLSGKKLPIEETKTKAKINLVLHHEGDILNKTVSLSIKNSNNNLAELIWEKGVSLAVEARKSLNTYSVKSEPMDLILAPGGGGILIHEACGHLLEADYILDNNSVFSKILGKKVASESITICDRGDEEEDWVYEPFDCEGSPTSNVKLIANGYVSGVLTDVKTAKVLGCPNTGNARRQSYEFLPICRMRNTYLCAGNVLPEDIIKDTKKGIYAAAFTGGEVNSQTGDFVFWVNDGYLVEKGEITRPVRPFLYAGNALDVLSKIDVVGNDLQFEVGECGKEGQVVDVSYGQPTVRILSQNIGGLK